MKKAYLLIDFGSTYTKLTLIDINNMEIIANSKAVTTVESHIMEGFNQAFSMLKQKYAESDVQIIKKLACSSAAGGLKMVTIGLVPELTVEAAKRAALGAGARVLKSYCYELTIAEITEIKNMKVDIILLSGGTDGGNKRTIIENAQKIARNFTNIPIIVAGNKCALDEISVIFAENHVDFIKTENVMPKLNQINVIPVREKIREIFMNNIIKSKGMSSVEDYIDGILMPTPAAVLKACEVLAKGTENFDGVGDLVVVDIGGATTDIHSIAEGYPSKTGINLKGLEEPYAKRTVEGDLGMRYSALALLEASDEKMFKEFLACSDIEKKCRYRHDNIEYVPNSDEEKAFDKAMAKIATKLAMSRHAGYIEIAFTPLGEVFNQYGKDLLEVKYIIGTGGVIIHSDNPTEILEAAKFSSLEPTLLKPKSPYLKVDSCYILSAMGLLASELPDCAFKILKKYIIEI